MMTARSATQKGIILKSKNEIEIMRRAGALVCQVLDHVCGLVKVGVTTGELNEVAEKMISDAGAEALFKGVVNPAASYPFPAALCTSVNDEVVHGVPGDRALKAGDVLSIDCGVRIDGFCGDSARTVAVGDVSDDAKSLLKVTEDSLKLAISEMKVGRMWSEVATAIQKKVESAGMSVVREFVGHGIGQEMHEEPKVPNYHDRSQRKSDFRLEEGLTLAVEPMVTLGRCDVMYADADAWVIVTKDGSFAAHFEHSIAMTAKGPLILTAA
ncbi:MAG: type I methionyl aminopeptidase [Phycisphaerae bacterium]